MQKNGTNQVDKTGETDIAWAAITGDGESYIRHNPKLRNPIDWKWTLPISLIAIAATCLILAITKG